WTYQTFGIRGRTRRDDLVRAAASPLPSPAVVVAAFSVNELSNVSREQLLPRLLDRAARGDRIVIVEPLAGSVAPWWTAWREAFARGGGRADEWRFRMELPEIVARLDRAAGLDHREQTARSLASWSG